jgi:hypothetical protein
MEAPWRNSGTEVEFEALVVARLERFLESDFNRMEWLWLRCNQRGHLSTDRVVRRRPGSPAELAVRAAFLRAEQQKGP